MSIQIKLTVSAIPIWGISGGVWPFFSHTDYTFCFHESVILVSNGTNITCMIWLICRRNLLRGARISLTPLFLNFRTTTKLGVAPPRVHISRLIAGPSSSMWCSKGRLGGACLFHDGVQAVLLAVDRTASMLEAEGNQNNASHRALYELLVVSFSCILAKSCT